MPMVALIVSDRNFREAVLNRSQFALMILGVLLSAQIANAQERAEEWRQARLKKVEVAQPAHRSTFEAVLYEFKERKVLERFESGFNGLHPRVGGLATGSGIAAGTEFRKDSIGGIFNLKAGAQASLRHYQKYEFGIDIPRIANRDVFVELNGRQRNYP